MNDEHDITHYIYFPPDRESKFDRFMHYLGAFLAGMGFLAALIALGIWWEQYT